MLTFLSQQVLRWSALGLGVFYGVYHQSSINTADKVAAEKKDYQRRETLISQAKAEYAKRTSPEQSDAVSGGGMYLSLIHI